MTAWDTLQTLSVTGKDVNKPGVEYANWQLLLDKLSERNLRAGIDNVLNIDTDQPGVAWVFSHPKHVASQNHALTIGLSAETTGGTFVDETKMQLQYGHTSVDTMTSKRAKGKVKEISGYGGVGGSEGGAAWQGQEEGNAPGEEEQSRRNPVHRADVRHRRPKMPSPIFEVHIRWTWVALTRLKTA